MIYKWIAFLPSRTNRGIPVLNRYFGAYQNKELKVRGIEARRHDTPRAFTECQMEILRNMAKADSMKEVRKRLPECVAIFLRNANALKRHEIPASSLAFTTNLSKGPDEYTSMAIQHSAAKKLVQEGAKLHAGEGIRYVITNYQGEGMSRAMPLDILDTESLYDAKRYIELLARACSSVLEPFDPRYSAAELVSIQEACGSVRLPK